MSELLERLIGLVRVATFIACHAAVVMMILTGLWVVDVYMHTLGELQIFGRVPVAYLVHVLDVIVIAVYALFLTVDAVVTFKT